jgi:hypothetical protein
MRYPAQSGANHAENTDENTRYDKPARFARHATRTEQEISDRPVGLTCFGRGFSPLPKRSPETPPFRAGSAPTALKGGVSTGVGFTIKRYSVRKSTIIKWQNREERKIAHTGRILCAPRSSAKDWAACPIQIRTILTDNGTQFTDRFTAREKQASGTHVFDQACASARIEHRLISPRHPQTNGMVERFNGRISELCQQTRFRSAAELEQTLMNYRQACNQFIPQQAIGYHSPIDALKLWQAEHPERFVILNCRIHAMLSRQ